MNFCRLPPERLFAGDSSLPRLYGEARDSLTRKRARSLHAHEPAADESDTVRRQQCVIGKMHFGYRTAPEALFRDESETETTALPRDRAGPRHDRRSSPRCPY